MAVADNSGDVVELFRPRQGGADELGDACNVLGLSHRRWQASTPFFYLKRSPVRVTPIVDRRCPLTTSKAQNVRPTLGTSSTVPSTTPIFNNIGPNNAVAGAAASDVEAGDEFVSVPRFATFIFPGRCWFGSCSSAVTCPTSASLKSVCGGVGRSCWWSSALAARPFLQIILFISVVHFHDVAAAASRRKVFRQVSHATHRQPAPH